MTSRPRLAAIDAMARNPTMMALDALELSSHYFANHCAEFHGDLFLPAVLQKIAELKRDDLPAFESLRAELKAARCRVGELDKEIAKLGGAERGRGDSKPGQGRALNLAAPEPWPEPVDGAALLDGLVAAIRRYVILGNEAARATALWCVHTHAIDAAHNSPRLAITSAEKQCGKSTLLDVIERLVPRPLLAVNLSAAGVFRTIEIVKPTLLIDEADSFLGDNEPLRGVLNAGHKRGAHVIRVEGDALEPRMFDTFAAVAVAAIGKLPDTLEDRAIRIALRRRRDDEPTTNFDAAKALELNALCRQAARWTNDHVAVLRDADPPMPGGIFNRQADNWRLLFAIADLAGGDWPRLAREAAGQLVGANQDSSARVALLGDIQALFAERGTARLASADICAALAAKEDRPWPEWHRGKPITARQLAKLLHPFDIRPIQIWDADSNVRGYDLAAFDDAFARYLGNSSAKTLEPKQTTGFLAIPSARPKASPADGNPPKAAQYLASSGLADRNGGAGPAQDGGDLSELPEILDHRRDNTKWHGRI